MLRYEYCILPYSELSSLNLSVAFGNLSSRDRYFCAHLRSLLSSWYSDSSSELSSDLASSSALPTKSAVLEMRLSTEISGSASHQHIPAYSQADRVAAAEEKARSYWSLEVSPAP